MKKIMLLGSGELGKEFVISAKRMGYFVVAVDSYRPAPAMQVADESYVCNMLDAEALKKCIDMFAPDVIVPEIEAIATEVLYQYETDGIQVVPSARAVNLTMNRDAIRNRATELGIRTAKFAYAENIDEYIAAVELIGLPCVIKPVMSSSGKGQSVIQVGDDILDAYQYALSNMRGDRNKVIVEEFIDFDSEITLLTIKQKNGPTLFCDPIGHVQKNGDYQYSWQPAPLPSLLAWRAIQVMAETITDDLGGAGLFGVEFFIKNGEVIFSELSPRPHDTGMVTLKSQKLTEFDLHLRAIMGLPIHQLDLQVVAPAASAVVLSQIASNTTPIFDGIEKALSVRGTDVRVFGKPNTKINRRMAVVLADTVQEAQAAAAKITVR
jgi:phosphoribosylglycinamide formyltransferase 2